jgi:hypothetical protein
MTEADAVGASFGSDIAALIAFGTSEAIRGSETCTTVNAPSGGTFQECNRSFSNRGEVGVILLSGILGYPLGVFTTQRAISRDAWRH